MKTKEISIKKLMGKEMMIGNYFFEKETGRLIEIDSENIFDAWKHTNKYKGVPIDIVYIKMLNGKPLDDVISYQFGDVCIMHTGPKKETKWAVGFVDLLGLVRWTKTEIEYVHQLQHICMDINQKALQFIEKDFWF